MSQNDYVLKKKHAVRAMQWDGTIDGAHELMMKVRNAACGGGPVVIDEIEEILRIDWDITIGARFSGVGGSLHVRKGDWVVQYGPNGELTCCKPERFAEWYSDL